MSLESNPQKQERKIKGITNHRVIVVVNIPYEEGFYKDSFDVFKLCIDSLIATVNSNASITVVNNGSNTKVADFLNQYSVEKKIDTLSSQIESWMKDFQTMNIHNQIINGFNYIETSNSSLDLFNSKINFKWYELKKWIIKKAFAFFIIKKPYH